MAEQNNSNSEPRESLEWEVHPFTKYPLRSLFLLVFISFVLLGVYAYSEGNIILTVVSLLLLFGTLSPYFMKTFYRIDERGIYQKRGSMEIHRSWDQFRRYHVSREVLHLSPFPYSSRLDAFRGMNVLLDKDRKAVIVGLVDKMIGKRETDHRDNGDEVHDVG